MPSANQYLRYIDQTQGRVEKITASLKALKESKAGAPKAKVAKIAAKIKLQQEELKSSKTKLKEHKDNLKGAKKITAKAAAKKTAAPKAKAVAPKAQTNKVAKTASKAKAADPVEENALSPFETQLLNAVTALATKVKVLEEKMVSLESLAEKAV
jgi:hypothetical protein